LIFPKNYLINKTSYECKQVKCQTAVKKWEKKFVNSENELQKKEMKW
jgi:hypothetical protein